MENFARTEEEKVYKEKNEFDACISSSDDVIDSMTRLTGTSVRGRFTDGSGSIIGPLYTNIRCDQPHCVVA